MEINKKHEDLKVLSGYVYKSDKTKKPNGWETVTTKENSKTGFYGEVFSNGKDIAVVFRGTQKDDYGDIISDISLQNGTTPIQVLDAKGLYEQVKKDYPNANITLTGHSLGGSVAQEIALQTGAEAVTFGAYGIGDAHEKLPKNVDNITNYGNEKDPVFMSNLENQVGKTMILTDKENKTDDSAFYPTKSITKDSDVNKHYIKNMGNLSDAIEYKKDGEPGVKNPVLKGNIEYNEKEPFTKEQIGKMSSEEFSKNEKEIMEQLKQGSIKSEVPDFSNYTNPELSTDKIFTREEIGSMSKDDFAKNEKAIDYQMKTIGIPTQNQVEAKSNTKAENKSKSQSSSKSSSSSNSSSSGDGRWVTVNGKHVLMED